MLAALFSGGKDSTYATYLAIRAGQKIGCLVSIIPENKESYLFHTPNISLVDKLAEAMEIPLVKMTSFGEREKELNDLKNALKEAKERFSVTGVLTGAISSVYQASRIQRVCFELGLECFNPLWLRDEQNHIEEIIRNDFHVIFTGVFAHPLDKSWLGRTLNALTARELGELRKSHGINPAGEGGEYETLVLDCPLYKKRLFIHSSERTFKGGAGVLEIKESELLPKSPFLDGMKNNPSEKPFLLHGSMGKK